MCHVSCVVNMSKYLIIDGYNVINKIRVFEAKKDASLQSAREAFLNTLKEFSNRKNLFDKIVVVFDGSSEDIGITRYTYGGIEVLFTIKGRDADKVIIEILKKAGSDSKLVICSDDNYVRNHARVFGAEIMSVRELEHIILLKKKPNNSTIQEKPIDYNEAKEINNELKKRWGIT